MNLKGLVHRELGEELNEKELAAILPTSSHEKVELPFRHFLGDGDQCIFQRQAETESEWSLGHSLCEVEKSRP